MQEDLIEQLDFFVPTELGVTPKGEIDMMRWPFFSIAKTPPTTPLVYERGNVMLKISPGEAGLPMQSDKELLLYAAGHIRSALNRGEDVGPRVQFNVYDFFKWSRRSTGGKQYELMDAAISRLSGARITANMDTDSHRDKVYDGFCTARLTEDKKTGIITVQMRLADWIYDAIVKKEVLGYHPKYFEISGALGKRLYEIVRKGCGYKPRFEIRMKLLWEYSGTNLPLHKFRYNVKNFIKNKAIPDYLLSYDQGRDILVAQNASKSVD